MTPMRRLTLRAAAAALLLAPPGAAAAQATGQPAAPPASGEAARVRAGVAVRPDTVTVGDPLTVVVRVEAPAGATVTFPLGPDSAAAVAPLDSRRVAQQPGAAGVVDHLATYRLAAWDVGDQPIALGGDVVVRVGDAERRVPLGALRVHVRSVLPADSALRVPKPARAPLPDAAPIWVRWWPWLLAALALLLLSAWLVRRWLRKRAERPKEDAYRRAVGEFERLERMGLVEAGERGRHVALAVEVLRDYAAERLPAVPTSHTSTELLRALDANPDVPHDRLARLLEDADLVKFAAAPVAAEGARAASAEARAVVDEIERRIREREKREAEQAAARERADRDAARRYEEERRRASRDREAA